jgi:hypothetical protein
MTYSEPGSKAYSECELDINVHVLPKFFDVVKNQLKDITTQ